MTTFRILPMLAAFASTALAIGLSPAAGAADDKPVDIGKFEYEGACAVCHGATGRGGGPMASKLTVRMPDLTVLAKNNSGVFPFDRVYQVIDGRQWVDSHGSREMPIWGRAFRLQSSVYFDTRIPFDSESSARSRILALTEYVYRLQGK